MFHQSCIKLIDPLQIFDTVLFSNHCAVWEETVRGVDASGEDGGLWPDGAPVSRQLPRLDQVHGSPSGVLRDRESSGRGREGTQDHFIQVTTKLFDDERVMRFTATIYFCLYIILYRNLIGIIYFWYIKRYVGVITVKTRSCMHFFGGGVILLINCYRTTNFYSSQIHVLLIEGTFEGHKVYDICFVNCII